MVMNFNSPIFLFLFLPTFIFVYYFTGKRAKLFVGILGSILFYAWGNLIFIPLMLGLVIFAYCLSLGINQWRTQKTSFVLLWAGIFLVVALLVGFKFRQNLRYPLGLSYVAFQVIAYFIEVYYKKVDCEKNIINFSFYLLMFPKISVGPITRYSQLQSQIKNVRVEPQNVANGLRRFIVGFVKKTLIADTLARVVNPIFDLVSPSISPLIAWLVIVSYSIQLYFDFSGYTDMALGLGRMMGIQFIENFNFPYISKNIGEFWRRWHISLSSWFRDFVFYPLERHRLKWIGQPVNILIVFVLTGLWHGLMTNFIIWGLIHGLALVFESTFLGKRMRTLWVPLQHIYALGVVMVGWVFFRSPTPHFALVYLRRMIGDTRGIVNLPFEWTSPLPIIEPTFVVALIMGILFSFPIAGLVESLMKKIRHTENSNWVIAQIVGDFVLIILLFLAIAANANSTFSPGIYDAF